jgi:quinone-modifying oxidoreductase subunit QmoC
VGTVIGVGSMTGLVHTPLAFWSPMKIFANVGAIVILIGSVMLFLGRIGRREKINRGTWFDWYLVVLLNVVVATGILSQVARLLEIPAAAFTVYVIHLIAVYCLLTYIPFSKLSHMVYRSLAIHHGRLTGRIPPGDPLATAAAAT